MAQSDRNLRHVFPPGVAGEARCSGIVGVKTVTRVREMNSVVTCASLALCLYPLVLRQGLGVGPTRGQGWAGLGWGVILWRESGKQNFQQSRPSWKLGV